MRSGRQLGVAAPRVPARALVIAASFGGTGNGHTSRLPDPVFKAAVDAKAQLEKTGSAEGLAVAILAPPKWCDQTKLNEALASTVAKLADEGITAVVVQGERHRWGAITKMKASARTSAVRTSPPWSRRG